jgi:hypothetical protein
VASAAFHECGHATACRYGGARPGNIGVGSYLVWPSFFTNVTDSYRLDQAARIRTDLGGPPPSACAGRAAVPAAACGPGLIERAGRGCAPVAAPPQAR